MQITLYKYSAIRRRRGTGDEFYSYRFDTETMFDALDRVCDEAAKTGMDVDLRGYNDYLHKWELLCTFHPDGTATSWAGITRRFTHDPAKYWADL